VPDACCFLEWFMPFACNQHNIAILRIENGLLDRLCTIRLNIQNPVCRNAGGDLPNDDSRDFAARIVIRYYRLIRQLCRYGTHQGPLSFVTISATAKNAD
jgi:hypothetical protein